MVNKKALVISHAATRTGAPILLLNLASVLKDIGDYKVDFLLMEDGDLRKQFEDLGSTYLFWEEKVTVKADGSVSSSPNPHLRNDNINSYDFIVANTVVSSYILPIVRKLYSGVILTYVHELKSVCNLFTSQALWNVLKICSDIFLSPCEAVKDYLVKEHSINSKSIIKLPYYIHPSTINKEEKHNKKFMIGGCGTIDVRKGADLFMQAILVFNQRYPNLPIHFIWKGGNRNSIEVQLFEKDINYLNLEERVEFESPSDEMQSFYNKLDVFLLLSREDPYPLVMLEAANSKVPSICFKNSGGAPEFVEGNGCVIDYLDIDAVVDAIYHYYTNPEKRQKDGSVSFKKLTEVHQNKYAIYNILLEAVNEAKISMRNFENYKFQKNGE